MADTPEPTPRKPQSALERDVRIRANRAETMAMGLLGLGAVLVLIGVILALSGGGLVCMLLGGISFLTGCIENVRAEVLYVRAKIERD